MKYDDVCLIVGQIIVTTWATDLLITGVKYTTKKVKEFKENLKVKEMKNGKKSEDYVDVEYNCTYC